MTITIEELMRRVAEPCLPPAREQHAPGSQTRVGNQERGVPWTPADVDPHAYLAAPLPAATADHAEARAVRTGLGERREL